MDGKRKQSNTRKMAMHVNLLNDVECNKEGRLPFKDRPDIIMSHRHSATRTRMVGPDV